MKITNWKDIFPIIGVENHLIVGGNGEITIGFNLLLKEVYTFSVQDAKRFNEEFTKLLKLLPAHTTVHKQDFFYSSEYKNNTPPTGVIDQENTRYFNGRPILNHYSNLYITYSNKPLNSNPNTNSFHRGNGNYLKGSKKEYQKHLGEIRSNIDTVTSFIDNLSNIKTFRMDNDQLGSALYDFFNLSYNEQSLNFTEKQLPPLEMENELRIGNQFVKVLSLTKESDSIFSSGTTKGVQPKDSKIKINPNIPLPTSLVYPLGIGLPINHILNTIITVKDKDVLNKELEIEKRNLNLVKTFSKSASFKHEAVIEFEDTIAGHGFLPVDVSVNVILNHYDLNQLNDNISLTTTAFSNIGAKTWVENADTGNLFFASSPGYAHANYRKFLSVAELAVCYLHKETHYYSDQKGYLFVDRFGAPKIIDLWDSKLISNKNMLIIGPSGSGKSVWINTMINQSLYQGHHIIIVDIGHSYKRNCELNGGKYFDSSEIKKIGSNPFLYCEKDTKGNYIYNNLEDSDGKEDIINTIYTILVKIWKGKEAISQENKAILKEMIKRFYDYVNIQKIFPDLIEFTIFLTKYREEIASPYEKLKFDFESLNLLLKPFTEGQYKHLLNAKENVDINKDNFVVFDLESIQSNKDIFSILSVIIIELVVSKCNTLKGVKKDFIIDEGLDFLLDEEMGDYIGQMYRKIRKKEGRVALATQNASFLSDLPPVVKHSILINTDVKVLLDHSNHKASHNDLQSLLSLTKSDIILLDSIQRFEFFLKLGNKPFIYKNEISEFAEGVYTSKQKEVVEIEEIFKQTGSMTAAIKQFIENKTNKQ